MLIVTGIATLIQMKNHPIIYEMYNNTVSYHTGKKKILRKNVLRTIGYLSLLEQDNEGIAA